MAITFTDQCNIPPSGTDSLTADGEGMHSYFPYDFVRGLNNLGTYVNNHWHYVQAWQNTTLATAGRFKSVSSGAAHECFLFQIPVYVPLWAVRMVWTAGARCVSVSQSNVKVYLSRSPYVQLSSATFDATTLAAGHKSRTVAVSLTTGQYSLADDSTTGITPIDDDSTALFVSGTGIGMKRKGYAVVTALMGGVDAIVGVDDFSLWFLPS